MLISWLVDVPLKAAPSAVCIIYNVYHAAFLSKFLGSQKSPFGLWQLSYFSQLLSQSLKFRKAQSSQAMNYLIHLLQSCTILQSLTYPISQHGYCELCATHLGIDVRTCAFETLSRLPRPFTPQRGGTFVQPALRWKEDLARLLDSFLHPKELRVSLDHWELPLSHIGSGAPFQGAPAVLLRFTRNFYFSYHLTIFISLYYHHTFA